MVRLFVAMTLLSGCSGFLPRWGHTPPIIDTIVAAGGATLIAVGHETGDRQVMVAGTAVLIAFGIAALHGFDNALPTPVER